MMKTCPYASFEFHVWWLKFYWARLGTKLRRSRLHFCLHYQQISNCLDVRVS